MMKKFFVVVVMVIAMTLGSVGQAFANVTLDGVKTEDLDKVEELTDKWLYVVNNSDETSQYRLVSSTIRYAEYENHTGYVYTWTATVYDLETNEYITGMIIVDPDKIDLQIEGINKAIETM